MEVRSWRQVNEAGGLLAQRASLAGESALRHFLRLAGAQPPPKRIAPESAVAASAERTSFAGAHPPPKRTRRGSATFLVDLRTVGCFLLFMRFSLRALVEVFDRAP